MGIERRMEDTNLVDSLGPTVNEPEQVDDFPKELARRQFERFSIGKPLEVDRNERIEHRALIRWSLRSDETEQFLDQYGFGRTGTLVTHHGDEARQ